MYLHQAHALYNCSWFPALVSLSFNCREDHLSYYVCTALSSAAKDLQALLKCRRQIR